MKRRSEYKMCRRKKKLSLREAHKVAEKINARQISFVHAYFCPLCRSHHIGHPNPHNHYETDADENNYA